MKIIISKYIKSSIIKRLIEVISYINMRALFFIYAKNIKLRDKVVVVEILGGLGNQIFQYVAGKYLAKKLNAKLVLYIGELSNKSYIKRDFNLLKFNIKYDYLLDKKIIRLASYSDEINLNDYNLSNNLTFIKGYFQNKIFTNLYTGSFLEEILKDLTLREEINNPELKKIHELNSCCMHIRRGDYISDKDAVKMIEACPISYYKRAIDLMNSLEKDLHFFCFSDDIKWCKENFSHLPNITFIENDEANCIVDFYLMTQCKNYIISNSTFSWWASFLSINKDKKVIFPKPYFKSVEDDKKYDIGFANFNHIIEVQKYD